MRDVHLNPFYLTLTFDSEVKAAIKDIAIYTALAIIAPILSTLHKKMKEELSLLAVRQILIIDF